MSGVGYHNNMRRIMEVPLKKEEVQAEAHSDEDSSYTSYTSYSSDNPVYLDRVLKETIQQPSISAKVRYLDKEGFKNPDIVRLLSALMGRTIRPQHVRNVLTAELKRGKPGRPPKVDPRTIILIDKLQNQPSEQLLEERHKQDSA